MIFDIGRRRLRRGSLSCARAAAVAPEHSLGGFQFLELAGEPLSLCIDARERLGDPLLLLGDLVRHRHLYLQRKLSRETIDVFGVDQCPVNTASGISGRLRETGNLRASRDNRISRPARLNLAVPCSQQVSLLGPARVAVWAMTKRAAPERRRCALRRTLIRTGITETRRREALVVA